MKKTTYKDKARDELVKSLGEKREELRKLEFGVTGSKTRDVRLSRTIKKDIARIMTELTRLRSAVAK
ncbi:MAG: 50S ribosomal protein L29 [Minisyncoccia bacterium]